MHSLPSTSSNNNNNNMACPPETVPRRDSSKSVRFAENRSSIQYFNPGEKPCSVHKMGGV
ncbi:hypothetical protein BJX61DRAFT_496430 [Aspergillus egyptiacus]|nr:hypothetical protein BJX61DRAFT_496430 [Aspergillus egyptiacus]